MKCILISPFLFILSGVLWTGFPQTSDTTFSIGGIITNYSPNKAIYLAMYSSHEDFKQRKFYKKLRFLQNQVTSDSLRYVFTGVEPGEYIVVAFQDLNGDVKLNMGMFGPVEPYDVYKPNYGIFGPKFSKCKFLVNCDIDTANIVLK